MQYRARKADGAVMIIIHDGKVLLVKRRNLPLLSNRGAWSFVMGGKEEGEHYIETAYRELKEETSLEKEHLRLMGTIGKIWLFDRRKRLRWQNALFVFKSDTANVRLNYENAGYRWATFEQIAKGIDYTNVFINERAILGKIKSCLNESKRPKS